MITEVNDALCALLASGVPAGTEVRLDLPGQDRPAAGSGAGALCLFLFGLRNDLRGRESGWAEVRDERGGVLSRQSPSRRCELSYLVTAVAPAVPDEHALLDGALRAVLFIDSVPSNYLPPGLADPADPVQLAVADTGAGALWSSLGVPARASFVLTVSAAAVAEPDTDLEAAAEQLTLNAGRMAEAPAAGDAAGNGKAAPKRWRRTPTTEQAR